MYLVNCFVDFTLSSSSNHWCKLNFIYNIYIHTHTLTLQFEMNKKENVNLQLNNYFFLKKDNPIQVFSCYYYYYYYGVNDSNNNDDDDDNVVVIFVPSSIFVILESNWISVHKQM